MTDVKDASPSTIPLPMVAAINRALEQPSLAESLVVSGECRAAEHSMDRLAERYLDLYAHAGSLTSGR